MSLSVALSSETQSLLAKADNGCFESQLTVATYYLGSEFLPRDTDKSYFYHCQFLNQNYDDVIATRLISPYFYISTFAVAGILALNLRRLSEGKQHYLTALDYANRYLNVQERQKIIKKYNVYQRLDEIEMIENGTLVLSPRPNAS